MESSFKSWRIFILYKTNLFFFIKFVWRARQENKLPNSIVHAQYGSLTALAAALSAKNSPLIISYGGSDVFGVGAQGLKWILRDWLTRQAGWLATWRCQAIIVKSKELFDSLPSRVNKKAFIIPNGVRTDIFFPTNKNKCREQLGWDCNRPYIIFTPGRANNVIVKNSVLAIKVCEYVKKKLPDTEMQFIVDKKPNEVALMMNAADCLLLTSLHEGSPNVVKESMACNLPVITINVGDVSERLINVKPSKVVQSYDCEEIGNAVIEILNSRQRSNGHEELVKQGLTRELVAQQILSIYYQIWQDIHGKK
jgi:glycosyltransferase involved in cell wall biosynthesis